MIVVVFHDILGKGVGGEVDVGFVLGFHRQQVVAHALGFAPALCLTFQTVEHRQSYARAVVHQRIGRPQRRGVPVACTPYQHAERPQAKENMWQSSHSFCKDTQNIRKHKKTSKILYL